MDHYVNILWISFTNHFLNQLQYLITIFSRMFHYSNNLINRTFSVSVSSDNRRSIYIFKAGLSTDDTQTASTTDLKLRKTQIANCASSADTLVSSSKVNSERCCEPKYVTL